MNAIIQEAPATASLGVDMRGVIEFLRVPVAPVEPALVVSCGATGEGNAQLRRAVGRVYLQRLLVTVARTFPRLTDERLRRTVRCLVGALVLVDGPALAHEVLRPELTSWTWRLIAASSAEDRGAIEGLYRHFGALVLPIVVAHDRLPEDAELWCHSSGDHRLDFARLGCSVRSTTPLPELLHVRCRGRALRFETADGRTHELPLAALRPVADEFDGLRVRPATVLADLPTVVMQADRWFAAAYPRDGELRSSPLDLGLTDEGLAALHGNLQEGADLLRRWWPEAWQALGVDVQAIVPLQSLALDPHNETLPAFRGLIATSARPGYLAAQTLVHEMGHNRLNSLLEAVDLVRNSPEELHDSPFVDEPRPMLALLHGVLSFLNEIELNRRILGRVAPIGGLSLERYHERITGRVDAALATVVAHARLTRAGEEFVAKLREVRGAA